MAKYRVVHGCITTGPKDTDRIRAGELIELSDEEAKVHAEFIGPVTPPAPTLTEMEKLQASLEESKAQAAALLAERDAAQAALDEAKAQIEEIGKKKGAR